MEFQIKPKKEWIDYCKNNNLIAFQRDINKNYAKIIVADTYENFYNCIIKNHNTNHETNLYEYWNSTGMYKLYIDYDRKIGENTDNNNYKNDITSLVGYIKTLFGNKLKGISILKSIPDNEKKSFHIIFDGIHFSSRSILKKFMEEQIQPRFKDLFDKKIFDMKVYGDICFRSLLSSKYGQKRNLYLLDTNKFLNELEEIVIDTTDISYNLFLETCITYIPDYSELINYKSQDKKETNNKKVHLINDGDIYSDKEVVKKYLDILDPDRYHDRNKWLNVGYILYSINSEYKDLWFYFSSKWDKYNEDDAEIAWSSFQNSEYIYTILNLMHLAKIDNEEDYSEITKEIPNHDIKFLRPFDNVISKLIYRLYHEKFVCSNPEKNEWYFFNNIRWIKENKSFNLRKLMINDVFSKVENYRRELIKQNANEELVKNYHHILKILGSGNKLNCLELEFYNSNFYQIIDQNKDLIGFENGIYDLKNYEFRKGVSSDYVSLSTGYDFVEYKPDSKEWIELEELLNKILPNKNVRHFTMKAISSCLDGHVRDENFYIFSGKNNTGGNGKSTITDLLLKALGDYGCVAPVSLITCKRESANNANSALANIKNKRVVIMQEPESHEMIQAGTMKSLTGGDRISTRDLHSSQIEYKPHAKFFMCCNKIPSITEVDGGTLRRLKITEYISKFVDKPSSDIKNGMYEFKIDKDLKSKLDFYKPVFMCILLRYYKLYREEGLIPPDEVLKVTKKYENDNNAIKQFIDENIISGQKTDFITKDELKNIYKTDYFLKSNFGKFIHFITQLENALCCEFKLDKKNIYKINGWRIKTYIEDDDVDEN